jgi:alpha-glucosidase
MNGADATSLDLPLDFLGKGSWRAIELFDVEGKPDDWKRQNGTVSKADRLQVQLSPRGGFVAYLREQ